MCGAVELDGAIGARRETTVLLTKTGHKANHTVQRLAHPGLERF